MNPFREKATAINLFSFAVANHHLAFAAFASFVAIDFDSSLLLQGLALNRNCVFSATFNKEKEQKLGEVQSSKSVCVTIAKSTKASQKVRVMGSYPLSVQLKAGLVSVRS